MSFRVSFCSCGFLVLLVLRLPRLGKRELIFSYVCSVCACLDLSVSSSSWGLGRAAVCDCGTPWTFLLLFFCSTDRSKVVVPVLVLLFVALWFILRGDLLYVFPCVILFLCFSVLLVLRLLRLGKRKLILVLFVRLFGFCLFGFVGVLFLLGLGRAAVCDCGTPWTFLLPFSANYIAHCISRRCNIFK